MYCVTAGQDFIRCWRMALFPEDNVLGGQDFAGGGSELHSYLCKNDDGIVHACAVCVTGSVNRFWKGGTDSLKRKHFVCSQKANFCVIHMDYSVTGRQDFL